MNANFFNFIRIHLRLINLIFSSLFKFIRSQSFSLRFQLFFSLSHKNLNHFADLSGHFAADD